MTMQWLMITQRTRFNTYIVPPLRRSATAEFSRGFQSTVSAIYSPRRVSDA